VPEFLQYNADGMVLVLGDGMGTTPAFNVVLAPTASGAGTTDSFIDTVIASDDLYQGLTVEIATGAITQRRTVRNNTLLGLIPDEPFNPAPTPGDLFTILSPTAVATVLVGDKLALASNVPSAYINIGLDSAGGFISAHVESVQNFKVYGLITDNTTLLDISESNVYAGVTPILGSATDGRFRSDGLGFEELAAALLASPVPFGSSVAAQPAVLDTWVGWGLSAMPGNGVLITTEVDELVGYVVSSFPIVSPPGLPQEFRATFYGGCAGGIFMANENGVLSFLSSVLPVPPPNVPFLSRNLGANPLDLLGAKASIISGTAAPFAPLEIDLSLSSPGDFGVLGQWGASIFWAAPLNWTDINNTGVTLLGLDYGSRFDALADGPSNLVSEAGGLAWSIHNGSQLTFNSNNIALSPVLITTVTGTQGTLTTGGSTVTLLDEGNPGQLLSLVGPPGLVGGHTVLQGAKLLAGESVVDGALNAYVSVLGSQILVANGGLSTIANATTALVAVSSEAAISVESAQGIDGGAQGVFIVAAEGANALFGAAAGIDTTLAPAASYFAVAVVQRNASLNLAGAMALAQDQIGILGDQNARIWHDGDITGGELAVITLFGNSDLALGNLGGGALNLDASVSETIVVSGGSRLAIQVDVTIGAGTDGIVAAGGGNVTFADGVVPTFVVGGNELVVGPSPGEFNPYASALPAPYDSFANIGAGSHISRGL